MVSGPSGSIRSYKMYKESQLLIGHLDSLQNALLHLTSRDKASLNVAERAQNKAFHVYVLV